MVETFVISLPGETERRTKISDHLKSRNIDFTFFDATDGRQINVLEYPTYNKARRRRTHGRDLTGGEIGCLLSHKAIYEKIVSKNIPLALVLEDDSRLAKEFPQILNALTKTPVPFDLIRFFGSPKTNRSPHRKIIPLTNTHHLTRIRTTHGGAHATLVTPKGARKILNHMKTLTFPFDTLLGRTWETGANILTVHPGLATQDLSFESAIEDTRFDKTINLPSLQKHLFKLTRPLFKTSEAIGKTWIYWSTWLQDHQHASKHSTKS